MGVISETWSGWYEQNGTTFAIPDLSLVTTDGTKLSGSGTDQGDWTWTGKIDSSKNLELVKLYVGGKPHDRPVTYTGKRDVAGGKDIIEGTWTLLSSFGTFFLEKQPDRPVEETYTGYYEQYGKQFPMSSVLVTSGNKVSGRGSDNNGEFTWTGEFNPSTGAVTLHKLYEGSSTSFPYTGTKSVKNGQTVIEGSYSNNAGKFFLGVEAAPVSATPGTATPASGLWTGWYELGGKQHPDVKFTLETVGQVVTGRGSDDGGEFVWEGELKGKDQIVLTKTYVDGNDKVIYNGTISSKDGKRVIDGTWKFPVGDAAGRFRFELPEPVTSQEPLITSPRLPVGGAVSIRASSPSNAYLRLDGTRGQVNLQVGRHTTERFELVPQGKLNGEQVYAIKSQQSNHYVRLDPEMSPDQVSDGTVYPKGIGRATPVKAVDQQSKFTVVVVQVDGVFTHSFKLLDTGTPDLPTLFLRLNAANLSAGQTDDGSGEVNGQTYIGPSERLIVEAYPAS